MVGLSPNPVTGILIKRKQKHRQKKQRKKEAEMEGCSISPGMPRTAGGGTLPRSLRESAVLPTPRIHAFGSRTVLAASAVFGRCGFLCQQAQGTNMGQCKSDSHARAV